MATGYYHLGQGRLLWEPGTDEVRCPRCGAVVVFDTRPEVDTRVERLGLCAGTCRMWHLRRLE